MAFSCILHDLDGTGSRGGQPNSDFLAQQTNRLSTDFIENHRLEYHDPDLI